MDKKVDIIELKVEFLNAESNAGIAVFMGKETIEKDFQTINLKKDLGISIKFIL